MVLRTCLALLLVPFLSRPAAAQSKAARPSSTLASLIAEDWEWHLSRSPTYASVIGDRRWNDRWDDLSIDALAVEHRHDVAFLEKLDKLTKSKLSAEDALNADLLRRQHKAWIEADAVGTYVLPFSHLGYLPEGIKQFPGLQNAGQLAEQLRFETLDDYRDWLARLDSFPTYVEQTTARMREGIARKVVHPKVILDRVPAQLDSQINVAPTATLFYRPFTRFPPGVPEAERQKLADTGARLIRDRVQPALKGFRAFLVDSYIPAAPAQVGAWQWPNGEALYAHWIRVYTTTSMTADQVHALGLSEVARLRGEMEKVKAQTGFTGTMPEFFQHLRTDPRYFYKTPEELLLHYRAIAKRVDPALVKLFRTLPRAPYGVEPTPAAMAPDATTGFYYGGAADGSRAGAFWVNLYRPETRPRWEMVPLTLHEAVPGHHMQGALSAEAEGIPQFRRHGMEIAYTEGWGVYSETLGDELGVFDDAYDRFGQLTFEMWRAVRLVVDTGMHAKHWTRAQAISYYLENSPRPELDVTNEVDRYIAYPGQALAYKIGQLKIRELRTRAEQALGPRFDVRAFHDAVLLPGSLPLDVLETRIDGWIAEQKKSATGTH